MKTLIRLSLMNRRKFIGGSAAILGAAMCGPKVIMRLGAASADTPGSGEFLYNGIRLPAVWPPAQATPLPAVADDLPRTLPTPPYLITPPPVIPIDLGRQLFVDDFLIQTSTLRRTFHSAKYHEASPILRPDRPWEGNTASAFSDGVWYDREAGVFKMWYYGGETPKGVCHATSKDGIVWSKPIIDRVTGSNFVFVGRRDSTTIWRDSEDPNPQRRYKMFRPSKGGSTQPEKWGYYHASSPDGLVWEESEFRTGATGDRSTVFWNPFRKVWVYSMRNLVGWKKGMPRHRLYWESPEWAAGPTWDATGAGRLPNFWACADELDLPDPDLPLRTELYNLDAVAYESVLLGLFTIWRGDPEKDVRLGRPKRNDVGFGFSRDGFHWSRPERRAAFGYSPNKGDWNYGNVQSVGGGCCVVGDQLYFYCSGRSGTSNTTGLAVLRRDGFASLDTPADGHITTQLVTFRGRRLFVNADVSAGAIAAEVLDASGAVIAPFTRANCVPCTGDKTRHEIRWNSGVDLSRVAGRSVRLRFHVNRGEFYSFWVSDTGASNGYIAAGGPGLAEQRDV